MMVFIHPIVAGLIGAAITIALEVVAILSVAVVVAVQDKRKSDEIQKPILNDDDKN